MASPGSAASVPKSQIRRHYYLDSYVIIAPKRGLRPDLFGNDLQPHKVASDHCPFDNNTEPSLWQTPRGTHWEVKVIANGFPALSQDNPAAFGVQEVVINTPRHDHEFSDLSIEHIQEILAAYKDRIAQLSKLAGIRYVLVFKNDGPTAGASVAHAHCQIFALPMIPPKIERESDALNHYWDTHNKCAICDVMQWELQQKVRIISADKHMIAIAPHASSHALEAWIIPRRHVRKLADLNATELYSLAMNLKKLTARLDSAMISFNFFLQESLTTQDHHFVIKIEPRTTKYAGAELSTGIEINPVPPEYASLWYQGKAVSQKVT